MCVAGITRSKDGTVSSTSRDRCAAAAGKHRHRPDHSQATSEEHRAHRLRRPPLLGLALSWRWNAPARLRAQPGALPFGKHSGSRKEFWLRLLARTRRLGAVGVGLSWRWNAPARLRAQPGALPFGKHSGSRKEFWLRLLARTRRLGAVGVWL